MNNTGTIKGKIMSNGNVKGKVAAASQNTMNGIPAGGKSGQFLRKKTDEDYDVEWADFEIPPEYGLVTYDNTQTLTIT